MEKDHLSIEKVVKNLRKTNKIRNIQKSLLFTVCLNVTFTDNWQNLTT